MKRPGELVILTLLLSSCSRYYYVENTHNVPLFKERNEARISGSLAEGDETMSLEVQGAYSVTDHIAVALNAMSTSGGSVENNNYGKGTYIDAAIGYYQPFMNFVFLETYAGVGKGTQRHEFSNDFIYQDGWARLSFNKVYLQPSIGITLKDYFDVAISTRMGLLSYYNISYSPESTEIKNDMDFLKNQTHFMLEPAVTLRGGWKYVKLQTQLSLVEGLNQDDIEMAEQIHVSAGLYISLGKRFNRAKL